MTATADIPKTWPEKTIEIIVVNRCTPNDLQNELFAKGAACGLTCVIEIETNDGLSTARMTAWGRADGCEKLLAMYRMPRVYGPLYRFGQSE